MVESAKVLHEKKHLQELELWWWHDENVEPPLQWEDPIAEGRILFQKSDEKILQCLQPHHSIKRLVINGYCGESLPDWVGNLSSLLSLEISNCSGLKSLPEGICNLKYLQKLCIYNCSNLERRYARTNAKDWPKIARIPKVLVFPLHHLVSGILLGSKSWATPLIQFPCVFSFEFFCT